ncbi:MAG: 4Fe-4S dicluster domain-containing protein [Dehalococcoidales bacterium]|nr:4Fe-4S dicluster domain-containing protein [Dehalococcoidales bacterium]
METETIKEAKSFVDEVAAEPGGEKINECIQCGVCSGSCPTVEWWQYPPRKIIAMIRAGKRDMVLSSTSAFNCVTCYSCTVRCPRNINPTQLIHAVEAIAEREGYKPKTPTLTLHRGLRDAMMQGRVWELRLAMLFYLKTSLLEGMKMMRVAWDLISRGLMPLLPPKQTKKGGKEVTAILKAVEAMQKSGGAK